MSLFEVQQFSSEVGNTFIPKDDMEIFPVDLDGKICPHRFVHKSCSHREKLISKPDIMSHRVKGIVAKI